MISALIERLSRNSSTFATWWDQHHVGNGGGHKRLTHPVAGELELDFDVLLVPGQDQRIIIYSAQPRSAAADALRLLAGLGTEQMGATSRPP
ncbi:MAG: hypothetical protein M3Y33_06655 [Actinomycetota bacterium]|nr:hypothetical protein [Actinomycetota bacterium]